GLHPPLPPTDLAARVKNKRVQLTWVQSASNGITANRVYRASAAGGPFLPIATVLPGQPKYVDKRVPGRGRYYYRVTAVDTHALESGAAGAEVQVGSRRPQR
ncbi:MAG: hypothetical protein K0Q72_3024, partial [Armatimonadetes bacterium]|nr:hypothetical protein [Armatimonadota bacterium]